MALLGTLLAVQALFPANAPEAVRTAALTPLFEPRPGTAFALEARELRDYAKLSALKFRSYIRVTPPKGRCLTITVSEEEPDEVVCEPRPIAFTIAQLDRKGRLVWRVTTGDGDLGTDLTWPSPYRMAMVTPWNAKPDDPQVYRFIESCKSSATPDGGRKIALRLLGGETWTIRFPDADKALPQPAQPANLFMHQSSEKVSVASAGKKEEESKHDTPAQEPTKPPPVARRKDATEEPREISDPNDILADRVWWAISLRGAYEMPASYFQPYGSVARGMEGRCRYNFDGDPDDPGVGRIECHEVDGFKSVLIPLACIKDIGPRT